MLTTEQQNVVTMAIDAIEHDCLFKIGGYAGTGKTTVAKYIADEVPGCMPCAFTGKAAYRLTQKGLPAQTIHRTIYQHAEKVGKELRFTLKEGVAGSWFLIDEGSMIPEKVWRDLNSFGLPILLLGDPGQLEPVGRDAKLMHKCDVVLEQIHRQAAGNGIIQFATDVRLKQRDEHDLYPDVEIDTSGRAKVKDLKWADICICGFNRTRMKFNRVMRQLLGYEANLVSGERVIVLKNNANYGVFNGQMLAVETIIDVEGVWTTICVTDEGRKVKLPFYIDQFNSRSLNLRRDDVVFADYGYCITCHKSQGSEWDKVVVIDEQCPKLWDARRWRYTAITRASKGLRYFTKEKL